MRLLELCLSRAMMRAPVVILACAIGATAAVLRVPEEYESIQSALDEVAENDTVLVDTGEYAEALEAPPLSFVLLGNVEADTGDYTRPVINPSSLPGSDTLACLIVPAGSLPTVRQMSFVNDWRMYRRSRNAYRGGIVVRSAHVTVEDCRFDSVYYAIARAFTELESILDVRRCVFWKSQSYGVFGSGPHCRVMVENSHFVTDSAGTQIAAGPGSTIDCCTFEGQKVRNCITISGAAGRVSRCIFARYGPPPGDGQTNIAIDGHLFSGQIEDNLFLNCIVTWWPIDIGAPCAGETISVRRNQFLGCGASGIFGTSGFGTNCESESGRTQLEIEDNVFADCRGAIEPAQCAWFWSPAFILRNRFFNNRPETISTILASDSSVSLRENVFIGNTLALDQQTIEWDIPVDARFNYWGDSSGPYHETLNPDGLGDEVRGNVLFEPWYPDTSFLEAPPRTEPSVASYALRAFPNPFNASVTLKIEIPEPGIFRIELFDLLGRRVKELFVGPVAYEKIVRVDGGDLASGIYYARAWQTTHNRPVATAKLVLLK